MLNGAKSVRTVLLALMIVAVAGAASDAAVPPYLNFQGILLDDDLGVVVDSTYSLVFGIYDDSTGGALYWTENQVVSTENGLFTTFLGTSNPLPDSLFDSDLRWLEITLVGAGEYEPRTRIGTVAYSFRVQSVDGATGGSIYGDIQLHSTMTIGDLEGNPGALQITDGNAITVLIDGTDGSFQFPENSVSSSEIINESGIAAAFESPAVTLPQNMSTMTDLATLTITIPSDGFIVVQGRCTFQAEASFWHNLVRVQIDEDAGGPDVPTHYSEAGWFSGDDEGALVTTDASGSTSFFHRSESIYTDRVYYKAAGTYTFRLEGRAHDDNSSYAVSRIRNAFVTATFHPTSYGPVETAVNGVTAGEFDSASPIDMGPEGSGEYKVDLRALELETLRLQAQLERARRELAEARLGKR